MDFLHKITENEHRELFWNIPEEQKQGSISVIGGNVNNFRTPVKVTEYLGVTFPVKTLLTVLPDALKPKLPPLENLVFLSSTESGSFASAEELKMAMKNTDFALLVGDFSKNSVTAKAVGSACDFSASKNAPELAKKPQILITRDAVDLIAAVATEPLLMQENLIFFATMPQLQKLFRAVYYPKMLLLSQPLIQVAEALHKFTLSYPCSIITLHDGQILIAKNGEVFTTPLANTPYSPLSLWGGEAAARVAALNLYNPQQFAQATLAAILP